MSLRKISNELKENYNIDVCPSVVQDILKEEGYSRQKNRKAEQAGKPDPDRDAQFQHINDTVLEYTKTGQPVISIDCKKKENIGNFKNGGAEYAPKKQPVEVLDHDFPLPGNGKAVP